MRPRTALNSTCQALAAALILAGLFFAAACGDKTTDPRSEIDLYPFKVMARSASCSDIRNRLFLIDQRLVFWDLAGTCFDAGYSYRLFARNPDSVLCEMYESIGGQVLKYYDERYTAMFDTMVANLDDAKLGIGQTHSVQPIPF